MTMEGVMYWGTESPFHAVCIEADQSYKRQWAEVLDYLAFNPETAVEDGLKQEGDIKLTPLAIVSSEGPPDVVQAVLDVCPGAITIPDRYGEMPIHRAALQHRIAGDAEAVVRILRDADPSTLTAKDKYGKTPLICAVDSSRGVPSLGMVRVLLGLGETSDKNVGTIEELRARGREVAVVEDKKGRKAVDVIRARTKKVTDEKLKRDIVELLEKYETAETSGCECTIL